VKLLAKVSALAALFITISITLIPPSAKKMFHTAFASMEEDEMTVSRDVLESLPQSLYRSLPWAAHTIDSCVKIVAEAQRTNNPRRVRAWIDFERGMRAVKKSLARSKRAPSDDAPGDAFADASSSPTSSSRALDYLRTSGAWLPLRARSIHMLRRSPTVSLRPAPARSVPCRPQRTHRRIRDSPRRDHGSR